MKVSIVMVICKSKDGQKVELPYVFEDYKKAIAFQQREVLYNTERDYGSFIQKGCYIYDINRPTDDFRE